MTGDFITDVFEIVGDLYTDLSPLLVAIVGVFLGLAIIGVIVRFMMK